ncbi:hypothetical protein OU798_08630, partial [Prolixibacteraceae bacterium Z1-6]|nr:hypothetical protein [Prolixibacteraceae bacterium Z1-6]
MKNTTFICRKKQKRTNENLVLLKTGLSHFIGKAKIHLLTIFTFFLLTAASFTTKAQSCRLSDDIYASGFNTYNQTTCSGDTLIIPDNVAFILNQDYTMPSNINVIIIESGGQIRWDGQYTLTLNENTSIVIEDIVTDMGPESALYAVHNCTNNHELVIGDVMYSACNGGGNVCILFNDLIYAGGTLRLDPDQLFIGAAGDTVCDEPFPLNVQIEGFNYGTPSFSWSKTDGPGQVTYVPSNTVQNPTIEVDTPGTYKFKITVKLPLSDECLNDSVTVSSVVEVIVLATPLSTISLANINDDTTEVCLNETEPDITFTNAENEPVLVNYNINGGTTQSISIEANSSATITAPTNIAGVFEYNLESVYYQLTGPSCSNNAEGTKTVIVNPTYDETDLITICDNELPYQYGDSIFTGEGTKVLLLQSLSGCDSIVTVTLNVNPTYTGTDVVTICDSELPYQYGDSTFTEADTKDVIFKSALGCDSTIAVTLNVNPTYTGTDVVTICDSELPYQYGDSTFTEADTKDVIFKSVLGCDSTIAVTLNVNPTYTGTDVVTICDSELPYQYGDSTFTEANTKDVIFKSALGCDSTIAVTLNVNPTYTGTDVVTI